MDDIVRELGDCGTHPAVADAAHYAMAERIVRLRAEVARLDKAWHAKHESTKKAEASEREVWQEREQLRAEVEALRKENETYLRPLLADNERWNAELTAQVEALREVLTCVRDILPNARWSDDTRCMIDAAIAAQKKTP